MKPERLPWKEFERLPETPVELKPFDPASKRAAYRYKARLDEVLAPHGVKAEFFGSVELEIAGKGEWEYAVWLDDATWYPALTALINHVGSIWVLDEDFCVFHFQHEGHDVEVIPMRGAAAARNRAVMAHWRAHPEALKAYERLKREHAHSKRAYYWWKHNYIGDIVETL